MGWRIKAVGVLELLEEASVLGAGRVCPGEAGTAVTTLTEE